MNEFKIGDKVIVVRDSLSKHYGTEGVVVRVSSRTVDIRFPKVGFIVILDKSIVEKVK